MHNPRPHGKFDEGQALSMADQAMLRRLSLQATALKAAGGLPNWRSHHILPSGRKAEVVDMGGVFKVRAWRLQEQAQAQARARPVTPGNFPMLFCGAPLRWVVNLARGEKVRLALTGQCRRRLGGYGQHKLPPDALDLARLNIGYPPHADHLRPQQDDGLLYTQYHALYPGWYSGTMAEVAQCVLGWGRQNVPANEAGEWDNARMRLPGKVQRRMRAEMRGRILPGYLGSPPANGQVQYDFQFARSHVVTFAEDKRPWLVQITSGNAWAMPLPLVAGSDTEAFRRYVLSKGDTELQLLLDRFGGLPSGEAFPQKPAVMQAWARAGLIVKLCSTNHFYQHHSLYSACGWSVARHGREGYNTCLELKKTPGTDKGVIWAHGFKLRLRLGKLDNPYSKTPAQWVDMDRDGSLSRYLAQVYAALAAQQVEPGEMAAIRAKLRRLPPADLARRASGNVTDWLREADYWRNLELPPAITFSASINRVASGPFMPGRAIKVPEPYAHGNIDIDGEALISLRKLDKYPAKWDTVVFGYYSGNDLRVVKQHHDERTTSRQAEDDFESCMIVGEWSSRSQVSSVGVAGSVSTSDFDSREQVELSSETIIKIKGEDLGFDSRPRVIVPGIINLNGYAEGGVGRHRYYSRETTTTYKPSGYQIAAGACIPYLMRDAVLYPHARWQPFPVRVHHEKTWSWVNDPNSYRISYWENPNGEVFIRVIDYSWAPSTCSDFADEGSFFPESGDVTRMTLDIARGPSANLGWPRHPFVVLMGGGSDPKVKTFDTWETIPAEPAYVGAVEWEQRGVATASAGIRVESYFLPSPAPGEAQASLYVPATRNHLGRTFEAVAEGAARRGHTRFQGVRNMPLLIGVVQE